MAAVMGRTEISIKKTGSATSVPKTPIAKLMYYFDCICTCVEANSDAQMRRLRAYNTNYASLSKDEEAKLLILCLALSPDKLIGSILFPVNDNELDGFTNQFYELSTVSTRLVVAQSLLIGGQQRKVRKIMMFKKSWIENNYLDPFRSIERNRTTRALPSSQPRAVRQIIIVQRSSPPKPVARQQTRGLPANPPPSTRRQDSGCCNIL